MLDLLAGAKKWLETDTAWIAAMTESNKVLWLDRVTEKKPAYPQGVIRHVTTTYKYTMQGADNRLRIDDTTFEFIVHDEDMAHLTAVASVIEARFELATFPLLAANGSNSTTATLMSCKVATGTTIASLPQPSMQHKSIHRLTMRFKAQVSRIK
jgi:hypothetical protein